MAIKKDPRFWLAFGACAALVVAGWWGLGRATAYLRARGLGIFIYAIDGILLCCVLAGAVLSSQRKSATRPRHSDGGIQGYSTSFTWPRSKK